MTQKTIFEGYAFDSSQSPPIYCGQRIAIEGDQLLHFIDGQLRATVPVESAPEYVSTGWVADVGEKNKDLRALRKMHVVAE